MSLCVPSNYVINVNTYSLGTFTLVFGGRETSPLYYAITAYDLEVALNLLVGTRQVAIAPGI
jgi:hypothetical protein